MAMLDARFKPDCVSCSALCCVAPSFDVDQGFGYDKPAHIPCINLKEDYRCAVHDSLATCGFTGCVVYDCHGAGQWVTQTLFKGASWRDSPETAKAMFAAFARQTVLHELMLLLSTALQYITDPVQQQLLEAKLQELEQMSLLKSADGRNPDIENAKMSTGLLLKSLQQTSAFSELRTRYPA
jgi:hypothetical protein